MFVAITTIILAFLDAPSLEAQTKSYVERQGIVTPAGGCTPALQEKFVSHPGSQINPTAVNLIDGKLRLSRMFVFHGPCAKQILSFNTQQITLKSNLSYIIWNDGKLQRDPTLRSVRKVNIPAAWSSFVREHGVISVDDLSLNQPAYLVLYRDKSTYRVGWFMLNADGNPGPIKELLRSNLPILDADYFPSPDALTGGIGLVQRGSIGRVNVVSVEWAHGRLRH